MIQASRVMGETYAASVDRVKRCVRTGVLARFSLPLAGSLAALAMFTGCSSDGPARGAEVSSSAPNAAAAGVSDLPAVTVRNLGTGESADLKALLPAGKPLLVWFWAPY